MGWNGDSEAGRLQRGISRGNHFVTADISVHETLDSIGGHTCSAYFMTSICTNQPGHIQEAEG